MQVFQRYLYKELFTAVATVSLGFLGLFLFFDFVDELSNIGRSSPLGYGRYGVIQAIGFVLTLVPSRLYDLLPIAVLIGATMVMARFAQSSEFTALRTSGLSPLKALRSLLGLGFALAMLTFLLGDYAVPAANKAGQLLKASYLGKSATGSSGAWLKDNGGGRNYAINVGTLAPDTTLEKVRLFEFDAEGRIVSTIRTDTGVIEPEGSWTLKKIEKIELPNNNPTTLTPAKVTYTTLDTLSWPTNITVDMIATAILKPDRMGTWDLYRYMTHLQKNAQSAQRYELEFWRKLFYPMSCIVMLVLALPFAYFHFRGGSMTGYIFGGVLIGISFFVVNTVIGYFGVLNNWQPWLAAATPSMLYSILALLGFSWLVVYR